MTQLAFGFMLTVDQVEGRLEAVKDAARAKDHELAFALEISLWHDVLEAISEGAWDTQDLCKTALRTLSIRFPRVTP